MIMEKKKRLTIGEITYMGVMVALMILCSWINVPFAVPFTLQTFAVALIVYLLGTWKAFITLLTYLLLGLVGVPVFAGFKGGASVLLGPTGGYLLGFFVMIFIMGAVLKAGKKKIIKIVSGLLGVFFCYAFGTIWFYFVYLRSGNEKSIGAILLVCVVPYIIPDIIKILAASFIEERVKRHISVS